MAESKTKSKTSSTKKTKSRNQNNKPLIISICAAVVAVVVIIIIAVSLNNQGLNDSYFVSDSNKYVLTIDTSNESTEEGDDNYTPKKIHLVYTYSGDEITGLKSYYEYPDADKAKTAFDYMKENNSDEEELAKYEINGKYIIYTSPEDSYKDLKASDVEQQIKLMEQSTGSKNNEEENVEVEEETDSEEVKADETEE